MALKLPVSRPKLTPAFGTNTEYVLSALSETLTSKVSPSNNKRASIFVSKVATVAIISELPYVILKLLPGIKFCKLKIIVVPSTMDSLPIPRLVFIAVSKSL